MTAISILYMDDQMVVVHKPSGLRTIPDGYHPDLPCLSALLTDRIGKVWVVHRLDKETSGLVIFALTSQAHRILNEEFATRQVIKTYHALITGLPAWVETTIDLPLRVDGDRQHRTVVDRAKGKPATTHITVIRTYLHTSLVTAHPETGYTHQIRTHLAALGYPIVGDALYHSLTDRSKAAPGPRVMLHASEVRLMHPITGQPIHWMDPLPPEFDQEFTP